jgi:undecaprenyl-diphosphatase
VQGITNFGFPSGHALMGVAFYGLLIWWIMDNIKDKWQKRIMISFLLFLLFLIGFSRVYLRVHYLTDVIAGYCIGTAWLISCLWLMDKVRRRKN